MSRPHTREYLRAVVDERVNPDDGGLDHELECGHVIRGRLRRDLVPVARQFCRQCWDDDKAAAAPPPPRVTPAAAGVVVQLDRELARYVGGLLSGHLARRDLEHPELARAALDVIARACATYDLSLTHEVEALHDEEEEPAAAGRWPGKG